MASGSEQTAVRARAAAVPLCPAASACEQQASGASRSPLLIHRHAASVLQHAAKHVTVQVGRGHHVFVRVRRRLAHERAERLCREGQEWGRRGGEMRGAARQQQGGSRWRAHPAGGWRRPPSCASQTAQSSREQTGPPWGTAAPRRLRDQGGEAHASQLHAGGAASSAFPLADAARQRRRAHSPSLRLHTATAPALSRMCMACASTFCRRARR